MSDRSERVERLVSETIDNEIDYSVSELIRRALRIARLQKDFRNIAWLERELLPFGSKLSKESLGIELYSYVGDENRIREFWDKDTERIIEERRFSQYDDKGALTGKESVLGLAIPDIESNLEGLLLERENSKIPNNVASELIARYDKKISDQRALLTLHINERKTILNHVRMRVLKYLHQTEALIAYENINADLFESAKQTVRSKLSMIAPDVLTMLETAENRLVEGSAESYSHALSTCRRILKVIADEIYPPKDEPVVGSDGKTRKLGESEYISRLWQYLYETKGSHAGTDITLAVLNQLGPRIDSVYKLTNKGVHSEVIEHEARQCLIQTYLALSDIMEFTKSKK